ALAIIGGDPARFAPFSKLYHDALEKFGRTPLPISIHSPGHIADTDEQAREEMWPAYESSFGRIGRERGWGPTSHSHFMAEAINGSVYAGAPDSIAERITYAMQSTGATRFDLKYANGNMTHSKMMKSIELYATEVVPRVKKLMAK
ncbi:MAG: LLM class flavin-dependent oxidoreductase, partial [Rhodoluna sp.]